MRVTSIRRHVLVWLLGASAIGALLLAAAAYSALREEQNDTLDAHLREVALAAMPDGERSADAPPTEAVDPEERIVIARFDLRGERVYLSDPSVPLRRPERMGLTRQVVDGAAWDAFAVATTGGLSVAAQLTRAQALRAAESATELMLPFAGVSVLVGVLLVIALRRGLAPLDDAAKALAARSEAALDPLDEAGLPRELRPLVRAMNQLLARVGRSFEAQQRFVADAAHELRTPVAALRLQHQLAERAADGAAREQALRELGAGILRIQHLTEQLLDLSRAEPAAQLRATRETVALDALAAQVVSDLAVIADKRGIDLGLQRADPISVRGDASQLRILLANLIDNALRYTPRGGVVDVSVSDGADGPELSVADTGPGIAPAERERVFVRFFRGSAGRESAAPAASPGSGLGLAIVQAIAEGHGARVTLHDSSTGGLLVRVRFVGEAGAAKPVAALPPPVPTARAVPGAPA